MENSKCALYKLKEGVFKICYAENKITKVDFFGDVEIDETSNPSKISDEAIKQIKEYLTGERKEFDLPVAYNGTDFQMKVWNHITTIPYGETRSYKEIAEAVGSPKAMRAVGSTHSKNPLLAIIPCHRVIKTSDSKGSIKYADKIQELLLKVEHKDNK